MPQNPEPDDRLVDIENAIDELHRAHENRPDPEHLERVHRELEQAIDRAEVEDDLREPDGED